ncbi:MAG: hypothetical protein MJZ34_08115 [Paludibacteraceae bacterium]|nr:hypothetical protein [Paludibacteraceae bacterium]
MKIKIDIVVATQGDRFEMLKKMTLPSLLKATEGIEEINRIVLVVNNLRGRKLKSYDIFKKKSEKIEIIEGDSKYRLMNKYIPYVNTYGGNNYTIHCDDDRYYTRQKFLDFIEAVNIYPDKPIFLETYRIMKWDGSCASIASYHTIFLGITSINGRCIPATSMWLAPPKFLKKSMITNYKKQVETGFNDDELILTKEMFERHDDAIYLPTRSFNDSLEMDFIRDSYNFKPFVENKNTELKKQDLVFLELYGKDRIFDPGTYYKNAEVVVNDWNRIPIYLLKTFLENSYNHYLEYKFIDNKQTIDEKVIYQGWRMIDI